MLDYKVCQAEVFFDMISKASSTWVSKMRYILADEGWSRRLMSFSFFGFHRMA